MGTPWEWSARSSAPRDTATTQWARAGPLASRPTSCGLSSSKHRGRAGTGASGSTAMTSR
jgi:hypothetical protein